MVANVGSERVSATTETAATSLYGMTMGDVSRENARRFRRRAALVTEDGLTLTYDELDGRTTKLANALRADGIGEGDHLLWLGQNSFRVLELLVAASKLGACLCVANWRNTPQEMVQVLDDWDPVLVVSQDAEVGALLLQVRETWSGNAKWLVHDADDSDGYENYIAAAVPTDDEYPISGDAPLLAIYTAAFGGTPRAVVLTSDNLLSMALTVIIVRHFSAEDTMLVSATAFHIMYYTEALPIFLVGGLNVFLRRVEASEIAKLIETYRCTRAYLVSVTRDEIIEYNQSAGHDLTSLRATGTAEWHEFVSVDETPFGVNGGMYGQTEVTGIACYGAFGGEAAGIAGRPGPLASMRIVDDEGRELEVGAVGEIVVRGPMVMAGYHGHDGDTAEMLAAGWRRTRDLGRREDDGSITFVAPKTRIVKSGVENIYPVEVERCITAMEGVVESAIIGVPDDRWTQVVKAIVVVAPGFVVSADDVVAHCVSSIASYKKPRFVEFVDELPRIDGAVDYDALDDKFGGGNYPGGDTRAM
jgi:acyl-CoA synthetase (AMP-forming)/AMP-acid ligase II